MKNLKTPRKLGINPGKLGINPKKLGINPKKLGTRAGVFAAGTWFMLLVIYFVFFNVIVYSASNIVSEATDNLTTIELTNTNFEAIIGQSYCNSPRYYYNAETGERDTYSPSDYDTLFCEESRGVLSQDNCDEISGCTWENTTESYWFFWSTTGAASCIGDINSTVYGIDKNDPIIGRPRILPHNNTAFFQDLWVTYTPFEDPNICTHNNVIQNKTLCDLFSCSWSEVQAETGINSVNSIYSTVGDVFTFRHDFGFSNTGLSFLMNFLFIVLPLLALIISIYFMIPVIH